MKSDIYSEIKTKNAEEAMKSYSKDKLTPYEKIKTKEKIAELTQLLANSEYDVIGDDCCSVGGLNDASR